MPHLRILAVRLNVGVPAVTLIDRDDVGGEGCGERCVAFDDHQVVVILAGSLVAQIV
jgi:hypothetical protein